MKSVLKKLLIILIVFIIVFEFGFSNTVNAASSEVSENTINAITNLAGGVVSVVFWKDRLLITGLTFILNKIMEGVARTSGSTPEFGDGSLFMTPYDIFFNEYDILGINFFDLNGVKPDSITYKFRLAVSYWFYAIRTIAAIILLVVLIYVGIRMALSTAAQDKAKYKKMLIDWACSLVLIFILQYLAIGIIYLNNGIVEVLAKLLKGGATLADNLDDLIGEFALDAVVGIGITSMVSTAVFCCIVAQTLFFFIAYLNRMIKIGFLIIISPLIAITYSIDKMGDGKAQALNNWLKEFTYTILIQPFHCVIYIALIHTAFKLTYETSSITALFLPSSLRAAKINRLANGVLTILCIKFVNDGEKVVRKIFGFADDNSKTSMAAGAVVAATAVNNAKKIGTTTRKGINFARDTSTAIRTAMNNDASKVSAYLGSSAFKNSRVGKFTNNVQGKFNNLANTAKTSSLGTKASSLGAKAGGLANSASQKVQNLSNRISNSKVITGAKTLGGKLNGSGAKKFLGRHIRSGMPRALGTMAMMMTYATGDTSLLAANAYGQGVREGTTELFASSKGNLSSIEAENNNRQDEIEAEELQDEIDSAEEEVKAAGEDLGVEGNITDEQAAEILNSDEAKRASKRAKKAVEELNKQKEKYEEAQNATEMQKQKLEEAKAKSASAATESDKEKFKKDVEKEEEELKKKQEEEVEAEKEKEAAEAHASALRDEANKYYRLSKAVNNRAKLKAEKDNFDTKSARELRMARRSRGASKSKLEAQKKEILKLILELEKQKASGNEEDVNKDFTFSEKDSDSAVKTTDNIIKAVDLAVLSGGASIKASDYIKDSTGLTTEGQSTYNSLQKAINHYELLRRQAESAATYSKHASYNGDPDSLQDSIYKKSYGATKG